MHIKEFLKLVEIQTKIASVFPFLVGLLFSWSHFKLINWFYMILFFIAMLLFDMTTTAINNYQDFVKAKDDEYKYQTNIIGSAQLELKQVRSLIIIMGGIALGIGLLLSLLTGWLFLFMGGLCCFIGIFYTYGPIPLSRMPLGEVFSGVTMGLGIPAMTIYLNTFSSKLFYFQWEKDTFALTGQVSAVIAIGWASLPLIFTIANIMLANNLRDLDQDVLNHRFTLVFYIGRKHGSQLFQILQLSCYVTILLGLLFKVYEWPIVLILLTLPKVIKNLEKHRKELPHPKTFGYAIQNFLWFNGAYVVSLFLTVFIQHLH